MKNNNLSLSGNFYDKQYELIKQLQKKLNLAIVNYPLVTHQILEFYEKENFPVFFSTKQNLDVVLNNNSFFWAKQVLLQLNSDKDYDGLVGENIEILKANEANLEDPIAKKNIIVFLRTKDLSIKQKVLDILSFCFQKTFTNFKEIEINEKNFFKDNNLETLFTNFEVKVFNEKIVLIQLEGLKDNVVDSLLSNLKLDKKKKYKFILCGWSENLKKILVLSAFYEKEIYLIIEINNRMLFMIENDLPHTLIFEHNCFVWNDILKLLKKRIKII